MKHIMLDLETMSSSHDAAIVAIGACEFDPHGDGLPVGFDTQFYMRVSLESSMKAGLTVSADTILWWLQQSEDARRETFEGDAKPLDHAVKMFARFVAGNTMYPSREIAIWGNGATFDNVIIRSAFKSVDMVPCWSFKNDKCYRTVVNLIPEENRLVFERSGTSHNALSDAITQALYLQKCYKILGL